LNKPTTEQIAFARTMSKRQRAVLVVLADHPAHLSASEQADQEIFALVRHRLAQCHSTTPDGQGPFAWAATDVGKAIARKQASGDL
jgi:hypothetical protein